jgi:hypothetical protein
MGAAVAVDVRQTPNVDRVEQHGADVDEIEAEIAGNLPHDARLADPGVAGDEGRPLYADQQFQGLDEFGWLH